MILETSASWVGLIHKDRSVRIGFTNGVSLPSIEKDVPAGGIFAIVMDTQVVTEAYEFLEGQGDS